MLFTDHKPLIFMNNMAPHNPRMQRTLEELSEYDFSIKYQPGRSNEAADCLSRMEKMEVPTEEADKTLPKDFRLIQKVDGGGDSMVEALMVGMKDIATRQ